MRGGARPGAGRKPGTTFARTDVRSLRGEARQLMADMIGTGRDPLVAGADLYTDPSVPIEIRAMLIVGLAKFYHPALSAQAIQATSVTARLGGTELAARVAMMLEGGPALSTEAGPLDLDVIGEAEPDDDEADGP